MLDPAVRDAILDAGRVAHLGLVDDDQPFVLPVAYARDGDRVLFHGSTASRLFRRLADGAPACLTVTLLDGLVVARSAFESSMNYRCVLALGRCIALDGESKVEALHRITEHLMPGRWAELRPPTTRELAATRALALPLDEWSVKVGEGPPDDDQSDLDAPVWAGVVPIATSLGTPIDAPDLRGEHPPPNYLRDWAP